MISVETLQAEKAKMEQSLASWKGTLADAQRQALTAQQQIDVHSGHIERLDWLLAQLETAASAEVVDEAESSE